MSDTLDKLANLHAAEDFFKELDVPYEASVVHVNRLHILKRFNQYLRTTKPPVAGLAGDAQRDACRELLARAYQDFVQSTPAQEKVFKVFQDVDGAQHVGIDNLKASMPKRPGVV